VPELLHCYFEQSLPCGEVIRSPADTESFLKARIQHLHYELFRGNIDGTSACIPLEIVKEALSMNAAAIILAHNHPSGVAEPTQADQRITKRLTTALELVDIRLLDHLIVGSGPATSLASSGPL